LRFEPFDECREMRGNRRRESVVLVFQGSANCAGEPNISVASGIHLALRGTGQLFANAAIAVSRVAA
jgi:hypothetical protein